MKICIVGPSHLAALREAEKQGLVDTSAHEITYCGHLSRIYRHVAVRDGRIFFDTEEPVEPLVEDLLVSVEIADFDVFLIHPAVIDYVYLVNRLELTPETVRNCSTQMLIAGIRNAVAQRRVFRLASELRKVFDGPILASAAPLNSSPTSVPRPAAERDVADPLAVFLEPLVTKAVSDLGFEFVPQPAHTIQDCRTTAREYAVGSVKLKGDKAHCQFDALHMNAEYGALVFEHALRLIDGLEVGRAVAG